MNAKYSALLLATAMGAAHAEDLTYCRQGWTATQSHQFDAAVALYNRCMEQGELGPESLTRTYRNLAMTYGEEAGKPQQQLEAASKAIALAGLPDPWSDYINRANAYADLGQFDAAMRDYDEAAKNDPDPAYIHFNRGITYEQMQQRDKAREAFVLAYRNGLRTPELRQRFIVYGLIKPDSRIFPPGDVAGAQAEAKKDFSGAVRAFQPLADQGDAVAQLNIGTLYYGGLGLPQDYVQAANWTRKAAEQGDAEAESSLAGMYYQGRGVAIDDVQAMSWWQKAADQGNASAQFGLALEYLRDGATPPDYGKAVDWLQKAALQGYSDAEYLLGTLYFSGKGVKQDPVQAYMYMSLSAINENPRGIAGREQMASHLTPDQISTAKAAAAAFLAKSPWIAL